MSCLDITYFTENWKYFNKIIFKYKNSTVDSFLMKKLLKNEVCRSHAQCTGLTDVHCIREKSQQLRKKKKTWCTKHRCTISQFQTGTVSK